MEVDFVRALYEIWQVFDRVLPILILGDSKRSA